VADLTVRSCAFRFAPRLTCKSRDTAAISSCASRIWSSDIDAHHSICACQLPGPATVSADELLAAFDALS
jgi:hypothetical protein